MEQEPLLPKPARKSHSTWMLLAIYGDFCFNLLTFALYVGMNQPVEFPFVPGDLLLIGLLRTGILHLFYSQIQWTITFKAPFITTILSVFYLVVRSRYATTIEAWIMLLSSFTFCWIELFIYVHAMIVYDMDFWSNPFENVEQFDSEFVFPESPSYISNAPVIDQIPQDTRMGTSAPIPIIQPFSFQIAPETEKGQEIYALYLSRCQDLEKIVELIWKSPHKARVMLEFKNRHLLLPNYSLAMLQVSCIECVSEDFRSFQNLKNSCLESEKICTQSLHDDHMIHSLLTDQPLELAPEQGHELESLFVTYWKLDTKACLAVSHLVQAAIQIMEHRSIKAALSVKKYQRVIQQISFQQSSFNSNMLGQALQTICKQIQEKLDFALGLYNLLYYFTNRVNNILPVRQLDSSHPCYILANKPGTFSSISKHLFMLSFSNHYVGFPSDFETVWVPQLEVHQLLQYYVNLSLGTIDVSLLKKQRFFKINREAIEYGIGNLLKCNVQSALDSFNSIGDHGSMEIDIYVNACRMLLGDPPDSMSNFIITQMLPINSYMRTIQRYWEGIQEPILIFLVLYFEEYFSKLARLQIDPKLLEFVKNLNTISDFGNIAKDFICAVLMKPMAFVEAKSLDLPLKLLKKCADYKFTIQEKDILPEIWIKYEISEIYHFQQNYQKALEFLSITATIPKPVQKLPSFLRKEQDLSTSEMSESFSDKIHVQFEQKCLYQSQILQKRINE